MFVLFLGTMQVHAGRRLPLHQVVIPLHQGMSIERRSSASEASTQSQETLSCEPVLCKEEDLEPEEGEVTQAKTDRDMQVKMVQSTGCFEGPFSREDLLYVYDRMGESQCTFWKPGRLGKVVEDPWNDTIGSIHIHGDVLGVTISTILFSNGKFKLSLGRGLERRKCTVEDVHELAECILFRVTGRRIRDYRIHLISAIKLYDPVKSVYALGNVLEYSEAYELIRRPHFIEGGRVCAVRAYLDAKTHAHVAIDHGGWSHYTGFKTTDDLLRAERTFDACMDRYFRTMTA